MKISCTTHSSFPLLTKKRPQILDSLFKKDLGHDKKQKIMTMKKSKYTFIYLWSTDGSSLLYTALHYVYPTITNWISNRVFARIMMKKPCDNSLQNNQ